MAIQDKFNRSNVIYKITKDIDLGGETLTIPEGCTLDFQGGSFLNGTLNFTDLTAIKACYHIFKNINLAESSRFVGSAIKPVWFGVKGDGESDDTDAINYMLSFVKNIFTEKTSYRNESNTAPKILFDSKDGYLITSPITIGFLCNIYGNSVFIYDGEKIDNSAAIIIDNQTNTEFEFSVATKASKTVDLSDGIQMAGIKTINCIWCSFKIHHVYGFYRALYLQCHENYSCTWQCDFDIRFISHCVDGVVVDTRNNGFSNGCKLRNTIFRGAVSNITIPSNIKYGSYLKFTGDGSYAANSWELHSIHVEQSINRTVPIRLISCSLDAPNRFFKFSINNIRFENCGGVIMSVDNCTCKSIIFYSILYSETLKVEIDNKIYGANDTTVKSKGIIFNDSTVESYPLDLNLAKRVLFKNNKFRDIDDYFQLIGIAGYLPNTIDNISNYGCPSMAFKFSPGQIFRASWIPQGNRSYASILNEDNTEKIKTYVGIDCINSFIATASGFDHIVTNSDDMDNFSVINNSEITYTIMFFNLTAPIMKLESNMKIVPVINPRKLNTCGVSSNRPSLGSTHSNFEYYDETLHKPIWWTGSKWVDATGAEV